MASAADVDTATTASSTATRATTTTTRASNGSDGGAEVIVYAAACKEHEHDWFDAHNHVHLKRIADRVEAQLARAGACRVRAMATNGVCEEDWAALETLSSTASLSSSKTAVVVYPQFGIHPWHAASVSSGWLDRLRAVLLKYPGAGVGEAGLHFAGRQYNTKTHRAAQEAVLVAQLELAKDLARPISLHCVRAYGRLLELLQEHGPFPHHVVLHSYAGPVEMVAAFAKAGALFSFCGSLCDAASKASAKARAAAAVVPLEALLIETDAPDQLPAAALAAAKAHCNSSSASSTTTTSSSSDGDQAAVNEPSLLPMYVAAMAQLRKQSPCDLAAALYSNAERVFRFQRHAVSDKT